MQLKQYPKNNLNVGIESYFNKYQNDETVMDINGANPNKTNNSKEKDNCLSLPRQVFAHDGIQALHITVNPENGGSCGMLLLT